jgi:hypothetical protein
MFAKYGEIESCRIVLDQVTRESRCVRELSSICLLRACCARVCLRAELVSAARACRGFGFVKMVQPSAAEDAVRALNGFACLTAS